MVNYSCVRRMKYKKINIGKASIRAEVADSFFKKVKGLMFRKSLRKNKGMLLVFSREDYHPIWMFGMRFPIDIIWIDERMRVVNIVENSKPCLFCKTYFPKKKAKYVLEVNAGFVEKYKIRIGLKVDF